MIGNGIASVVVDDEEKKEVLRAFMKKYSPRQEWTFDPDQLRMVEVIRIQVTGYTGKESGFCETYTR